MLTIIFCLIGFLFNTLPPGGLVALYCLANFFCNFGPNTTTFILPGEVFPTRYRSTGHGISAASGKIGAILSQALVGPLRNIGGPDAFLNHIMQIFALFMYFPSQIWLICWLLGLFTSLLVPETKRKTLEELTGISFPLCADIKASFDTYQCQKYQGQWRIIGCSTYPLTNFHWTVAIPLVSADE